MYKTSIIQSDRPRNVSAWQAAAILYGDWGTSKAYVIGLAFALAGYSSFWLIAAVSCLSILVGLNYITICRYYPNGGGVYASVRRRSEVLALVGGFFLIADYIVTAALSALAAFEYLGVPFPQVWALLAISLIGFINFLGPRHTGNLAFLIAIPTIVVVCVLGGLSFFHFQEAVEAIQPLHGGVVENWTKFVGVIVALSGIEAVANSTGVMRLNPGSTNANPNVSKTATRAIVTVMVEVCFFTTLFGFAINALPGLVTDGVHVDAPGYPNVRDSMLRYMGQVFASNVVGPELGQLFGYLISIAFCILLLSAVNTAIVALVSLFFVMSRDGQLPKQFQKLNRFGVPKLPLLIATVAPLIVLYFVHNVAALANLYAVGFVGAIATNLGSTSTDKTLDLKWRERYIMFGTFLIMAAVEITLFIDKPDARAFVIAILAIGLLLRGLVMEWGQKKKPTKPTMAHPTVTELSKGMLKAKSEIVVEERVRTWPKTITRYERPLDEMHMHKGPMLCAVSHVGKALEFAIQECECYHQHLYVLFVREQKVIIEAEDHQHSWLEDKEACQIFDYAIGAIKEAPMTFLYTVSSHSSANIVSVASDLKVSRIILGLSRRHILLQMLQGNIVEEVRTILPSQIDLIVIS